MLKYLDKKLRKIDFYIIPKSNAIVIGNCNWKKGYDTIGTCWQINSVPHLGQPKSL